MEKWYPESKNIKVGSMEKFSNKLTDYFLRKGLIEAKQTPWCKYMIMHRVMDVISLLWLVPIGSLVAPWYISITFVLSYRFLRSRTGGFHAKSPLGCLLAATVTQLIGTSLVSRIESTLLLFCILFFSSCLIIYLAPANNPELHLTQEEIQALLPRIKMRLFLLWLLIVVLFFFVPLLATSLLVGVATTALLLVLSKSKIGVN